VGVQAEVVVHVAPSSHSRGECAYNAVAMCELLGMECNVPTDIVFSFAGLAARGGRTNHHADGWGLALYEGKAARIFREPAAAADSPLARFVREHPLKTLLAVAHVRKRTRGPVCLVNTHPFARELWGRQFAFAHHGTVKNVRRLKLGRFQPIGTTDSEYAFCALLGAIAGDFKAYPRAPSALAEAIAEHGARIGAGGTFNFLLGDGSQLIARCSTPAPHRPAGAVRAGHAGRRGSTVDFAG
jgi:glutamine amidotransferase